MRRIAEQNASVSRTDMAKEEHTVTSSALKNWLGSGLFGLTVFALTAFGPSEEASATEDFVDVPSFRIGSGALVSPSSAYTYYTGVGITSNARAADPWPMLDNLARALEEDPDKIYEFVRNEVETSFTYGLGKGARGAALDKEGSVFDQAHLMAELLRASGYSARYAWGTITLTAGEFEDWTGITDAGAASDFLGAGGIPATVSGSTDVTSVTLQHLWVEVQIGGTWYSFDPSMKTMVEESGLALQTKMGFSKSSLLSTAASGMTTATDNNTPRLKNANRAGIRSTLDTYAASLYANLDANDFDASMEEAMGGRSIERDLELVTTPLRQTALPYQTSEYTTFANDIPDVFRTEVTLTAGMTFSGSYFVDEIYGRKLGYRVTQPNHTGYQSNNPLDTLNAYFHPVVDGQDVLDTNDDLYMIPWYMDLFGYAIDHPYAASSGSYMDEDLEFHLSRTYELEGTLAHPLEFVLGLGKRGPEIGQRRSGETKVKDTTVYYHVKFGCTEECSYQEVSGKETMMKQMAEGWLQQTSRTSEIIEARASTRNQHHHTIGVLSTFVAGHASNHGIVGQAVKLDLSSAYSVTQREDNTAKRKAAIDTMAISAAALEGSIGDQVMDAVYSVSAPHKLDWASDPSNISNGDNRWIYWTTSSNWSSYVKSKLINESEAFDDMEAVAEDYVTAGYTLVLPRKSHLGPGFSYYDKTQGSTSLTYSIDRGGMFVALTSDWSAVGHTLVRNGNAEKGGGGSFSYNPMVDLGPDEAFEEKQFELYSQWADVNLQDGSLTLTLPPDITTGEGEFPYSLSFQRTWKSDQSTSAEFPGSYIDNVPAASGWQSNLRSDLSISGSGLEAMGSSSATRGAVSLVAFETLLALYEDASTDLERLERQVFAAIAAAWWADQIKGNTVTITHGPSSEAFLRIPGGDYLAQVGSNSELVKTGQRVPVHSMTGDKDVWGYGLESFVHYSGSGVKSEYDWWHGEGTSDGAVRLNGEGSLFRLEKQTFPSGVTVNYTYNSHDQLTEVETSLGRKLTLSYTGIGAVHTVSDPNSSRSVQFGYDSTYHHGRIKTVTNAEGHTVTYRYNDGPNGQPNGGNRLESISLPSDPDTPFLTFEWAEDRRLYKVINVEGKATEYLVGAGRRGAVRNALGEISETHYDEKGHAWRSFDGLGRESRTGYDGIGRAVWSVGQLGITANAALAAASVSEEDQLAGYTVTTYDEYSNVIAERTYPTDYHPSTNNDWIETTSEYTDVVGTFITHHDLASKQTDAMGNETDYTYYTSADGAYRAGRLKTESLPLVDTNGDGTPDTYPVTTYDYQSSGLLATVIDPEGMKTTFSYDANGFRSQVIVDQGTGTLNITWGFGHDAEGNITSVTDPRGNSYSATYDDLRRITERNAPLDATTKWTYDVDGLITQIDVATNAANTTWSTTIYSYYATKRTKSVTDPEGNVTKFFYDDISRLSVTEDAEGRRVKTYYDAAGQTTRVLRAWRSGIPDGDADVPMADCTRSGLVALYPNSLQQCYQHYTYWEDGQIKSVADAKGNTTQYTYDGYGRPLRTTFPDSTYEEIQTYDDNGNVLLKRQRRGWDTLDYQYDALNREVIGRFTGGIWSYTEYDLVGRVTKRAKKDVSSGVLSGAFTYSYDGAGRLLAKTYDGVTQLSNQYDDNGNRTRLTHGDGFYVEYGYDELNRMKIVCENTTASYSSGTASCSTSSKMLAEYTYNVQSQRTNVTLGNGNTTEYTYEADGALKTIAHIFEGGQASSADVTFTFGYTKANQMNSKTVSNSSFGWLPGVDATVDYIDPSTGESANEVNQYTKVDGASLTYDPVNLTSDGTNSYYFDRLHKLWKVETAADTVIYSVYVEGARSYKQLNGTITERYLWDGAHTIVDFDGGNQIFQNGEARRRYVYGSGIDERIAMIDETGSSIEISYYHTDQQGSVVAISDDTGSIVEAFTYDSFGNSSTLTGNPFRYSGRRMDSDTGLYYYRAREYSPTLGRFLQTDPIGYKDQMNLYAYVGNAPVSRIDPMGLATCEIEEANCDELEYDAGVAADELRAGAKDAKEVASILREGSQDDLSDKDREAFDQAYEALRMAGFETADEIDAVADVAIKAANKLDSDRTIIKLGSCPNNADSCARRGGWTIKVSVTFLEFDSSIRQSSFGHEGAHLAGVDPEYSHWTSAGRFYPGAQSIECWAFGDCGPIAEPPLPQYR